MALAKLKVLVIDDEQEMLRFLRQALSDLGAEVVTANNGQSGIAAHAEESFNLILLDIRMPGLEGMEVLHQLRAQRADVLVIVMTAYGSIESAVDAMKAGAADYLSKPLDLDHLELVIARTLKGQQQSEELRLLKNQVERQGSFEGLIGVSQKMQHVYQLIRRLADSDATVLIQGETGTGKELVAQAIHKRSGRREKAFMPVNCGALPETILESELFGHEKGAFTGAVQQKYGLIEQAEKGSLFLDEIEEMSPLLQVKLLRTIQEREVLRVGANHPTPVDFRLIGATSIDLRERMEQGALRADLFYRLSVVVVNLPPLRERTGDIPLLTQHFIATYAEKSQRSVQAIAPEAMMLLKAYAWPGNVRELENVIEQAVVLSPEETISSRDLPEHIAALAADGASVEVSDLPLRKAREQFERQYLMRILSRAEGNVAKAARMAGLNRQHLYEKMRRYGLRPG